MGTSVEIMLLGPLDVTRDGRRVDVTARTQRLALTVLALELGRTVSREAFYDALWEHDGPSDPRAALQVALSRLRATLGRDLVVTEASGYRLDDRVVTTDVRCVETLVRTAPTKPAARVRAFGEALTRWRGDALGEFDGVGALEPSRARLAGLRAHVREQWLGARLTVEEPADLVPELDALVTEQPHRERPMVLLLTALEACGRGVDALQRAREFRERLLDGAGLEPSPTFEAMHRRLLGGTARRGDTRESPVPVAAGGNTDATPPRLDADLGTRLPRPDVLFGRQLDLDRLAAVADRSPLTTVVGPGGVGKTSLVSVWLESQPAAAVVELHHLGRGEDIGASAADQLGIEDAGPRPLGAVAAHVAASRLLLVLDNCEHVLESVRELVGMLQRTGSAPRIVCTSRQRLGLHGEQVLHLSPLPVPADDAAIDLHEVDVVTLFVERARQADPVFAPGRDDERDIAAICRAVDGLPLAVELAAARVPAFGVAQLRNRVTRDIRILEQGGGRHRSLEAVLDWSIGLITDDARAVLRTAAAFDGPFTLAVLERVADPGSPTAQLLGRLVDAQLVFRAGSAGEPRYRMHVPTRLHVVDRLAPPVGLDDRLAAWAGDLVTAEVARLGRPGEAEAAARLLGELVNIRAAVRAALQADHPDRTFAIGEGLGRLVYLAEWADAASLIDLIADNATNHHTDAAAVAVAAAARTAAIRGSHAEAERRLQAGQQLLHGDPPTGWYLAHHARAVVAYYGGDFAAAVAHYTRVVEDHRVDEPERLVAALERGSATARKGDVERGRQLTAAALARLHEIGGEIVIAWGTYVLASIDLLEQPDAALAGFEAAIELARSAGGARQVERLSRVGHTAALVRAGRLAEARDHVPALLDDLLRGGNAIQLWNVVSLVALGCLTTDDPTTAAILHLAAERDTTAPRGGAVVDATRHLRGLATTLGPSRWGELRAQAATLRRDDVVALVREAIDRWPP